MSIFMSYEGVEGEASDAHGHAGWLDIKDVYWGVNRRVTSHTSTRNDRESANAEIRDLIVTRHMDSATPRLVIESCCGRGKDVVIHLTKTGTGSGADVFMEWTLKNALISKYEVEGRGQSNRRPLEKLTISFVDIEMKYTPYDENGSPMAPSVVGFDTSTNERR